MFISSPWIARIGRGAGWCAWLALAMVLSLWLARSIMLWDVVGLVPLLMCLAVGLMTWIVFQPVVGLYVFLTVIFLLPRLVEFHWLPRNTFWLNDLVVAAWSVHVAIRSLGRRGLPRTPFDLLAVLLGVVFLLSSLANSLPPMQVVAGLRYYFKYLIAYYLILAIGFSPATLRRVFVVLGVLAFAQLPLVVQQFISIGGPNDGVTGTLARNGMGLMAFWQMAAAAFLVGAYFAGFVSPRLAALAGLCMIPPLFGTVQATFFFFALVMACLAIPHVLTRNQRMLRRYLALSVLLPLVIGGLGLLASPSKRKAILETNTEYLHSVDKAVEYSETKGGGRLASLKDAWHSGDVSVAARLIGLGPATAGESAFAVTNLRSQGALGVTVTQLDFLLVDLGIMGALIVLTFIGKAFWINLRAFRRARTRHDRAVTYALFGIIPLYAVFYFYLPCWISDLTAFVFWVSLAYVTPISQRRMAPVRRRSPARPIVPAARPVRSLS